MPVCSVTGKIERTSRPAPCLFLSARCRERTGSRAWWRRDDRGFLLTGPDLIMNGERPKGWNLERDPYLLETNVPGVLPNWAMCGTGR